MLSTTNNPTTPKSKITMREDILFAPKKKKTDKIDCLANYRIRRRLLF